MMNDRTNAIGVITVAREILQQAYRNEDEYTPLQLMKLAYICHGVKLAFDRSPMFRENVEAWVYGPVVRELYQRTKKFGKALLPHTLLDDDTREECGEFNRGIIGVVLNKWGQLSGSQLSAATHQPATPWFKVWYYQGGKYSGNAIIRNKDIGIYYRGVLGLED